MTGGIGTYTVTHDGDKSAIAYRSPAGLLSYTGSEANCQAALVEWQRKYENLTPSIATKELDTAEYLGFMSSKLDQIRDVIQRKNKDYTAGGGPFANFEISEMMGLADAKTGLLIRMVDKIQRLKSHIKTGTLAVKNESADDAAMDIVGYGLVLLGMLENDRRKANGKKETKVSGS